MLQRSDRLQPRPILARVWTYLATHGVLSTLSYVRARLGFALSPPETASETRARLARSLSEQLSHTVISGLFTGMTLLPDTTWGRGDRAGQLLGLYEQEVQAVIEAEAPGYDCLIDIGAGDGYYAVGCILKSLFRHCHAFEISDASRKSIQQLALQNEVADRITIHGAATVDALMALPPACRESAFVLIDAEGAEFDLLTAGLICGFPHAFFVIELHPSCVSNGAAAVADLCARMSATHQVSRIAQGARDPNRFEVLRHLHDNERWLIASENRGQLMEWLIASPRPNVSP
jgi:hypothetical protein